MIPIDLPTAEKVLSDLGADDVTTELVLNNLRLYNQLIENYSMGMTKDLYLTYQLNVQVSKQLLALYGIKRRDSPPGEADGFNELLKTLKGETVKK